MEGEDIFCDKTLEYKNFNEQLASCHAKETINAYCNGFVLANFMSVDVIASPIRTSSRLNYTCFGVCNDYIGMGTNTGCVYLFDRGLLKHIQMITTKEGSITSIKFNINGSLLALGTSQGYVVVFKLDMKSKPDIVKLVHSWEHKSSAVTAMKWDSSVDTLYSADSLGRVSVLNAPSSKVKILFKKSSETILKGDSQVVQIDLADNKLIVSTLTQCYLCDTSRHTFTTVGQKLRNGEYGACFFQTKKISTLLYCARPGSRIWEVSTTDGKVLKTHQFKELLAIKPSPIFGLSANANPTRSTEAQSQSLVFGNLQKIGEKYLITWTESGIYIFDPVNVDVILWTNEIKNLKSIEVYGSEIYCLCEADVVVKLNFLPFFKCALKLYHLNLYDQSAEVCYSFTDRIISENFQQHFPEEMILSLMEHLSDNERSRFLYKHLENLCLVLRDHISRKVNPFLPGAIKLDSGIFVVNNQWNQLDEISGEENIFSNLSSKYIKQENSFETDSEVGIDENISLNPKLSSTIPDNENQSIIVTTTNLVRPTEYFKFSFESEKEKYESKSYLEKDITAGSLKISLNIKHSELDINQDKTIILSTTNHFREQLQDSFIFFNCEMLRLLAKEWFECIHHSLKALNIEYKANIIDCSHQSSQDTFILHHSSFSSLIMEQQVKDMVIMFYEIEAYSELFPNVKLMNYYIPWMDILLKKNYYLYSKDKGQCEMLEKNCIEFCTQRNILDGKQVCFANNYYFMLDWDRILIHLSNKPFQRIQTLLTFLTPFIGGEENQGFLKKFSPNSNTGPINFIVEAYRILYSDFNLGLDYCVRSFPGIQPWQFLAFCYLFKEKQEYFIHYIERIFSCFKHDQRINIIKLLTEDKEVIINWIYFLLSKNQNIDFDQLHCQCGIACPGAHINRWNYQEQLNTIIDAAAKMKPEDQYLIARICWRFCYWKGYLQILKNVCMMDEYLTYSVILGDMDLLKEPATNCFNDIKECQLLLDKMEKVFTIEKICYCGRPTVKLNSVGCFTSISWENVFRLIVKSFGPEKSLQILKSSTILSSKFYLHYQMILKIHEKQRDLIHGILEEVNAHLWANKKLKYIIPSLNDNLKCSDLQF